MSKKNEQLDRIESKLDQSLANQLLMMSPTDTEAQPSLEEEFGFFDEDAYGSWRSRAVDEYFANAAKSNDPIIQKALKSDMLPRRFLIADQVEAWEQLVDISRANDIAQARGEHGIGFTWFTYQGDVLPGNNPFRKRSKRFVPGTYLGKEPDFYGSTSDPFVKATKHDDDGTPVDWAFHEQRIGYTENDCLVFAREWLRREVDRLGSPSSDVDFSPRPI